ncbi:unnamed protein product [Strongylus vulgaris]|uniref:Glucuronosyltransferase n=1 Tax=Strongylus vulgaris TaxID=40348 RepID=A0A3P7JHD6_STRVU|nr:unnamed protein product [Strongylus vulgaris]
MLLNQPISPKQLLLRHCEFAARFGRISNLDPYGRQLSFAQYYLLDVLFAVVSTLVIIAYISLKLFNRHYSLPAKCKKD